MNGDGINDWLTRAAVLAEVEGVRVPMLEANVLEWEGGERRGWDLQALKAVHEMVAGLGAYGESRW